MTRYICGRCKQPFEIHGDYEPKKVDSVPYDDDCYYIEMGLLIDEHPLGIFPSRYNPKE